MTEGNHSSTAACKDFHSRAATAGTSYNLLFIQILDDFWTNSSSFSYSEILWNNFYYPNWLSPSHCFVLLFLGGVTYSQCLLKFVGLESFSIIISKTESKKLNKSWWVISQKWHWKHQSFQHLSHSHSDEPFSDGLPANTHRTQLMCLYPPQIDSLWGPHPDTSLKKGKAEQKGPNTKTDFPNKVSWPSFMFIKQ